MDLSSSMTVFTNKKEFTADRHFKWDSIKKFVWLAYTYSVCSLNFDLFSRISENVRPFDFILCEVTVGMPYMCMDFFIRQYTRRIDLNKSLNPLMKGITYGILLQTALWTLIHSNYLADALRFLAGSLHSVPSWARCPARNVTCSSLKDIFNRCRDKNMTPFEDTSSHVHYLKSFSTHDRSVLTSRFFVIAVVWLFNFFFSSVTDENLVKILKLTFIWRTLSTLIALIFVMISKKNYTSLAFAQIINISAPLSYTSSMVHVTYAYGIGFVGLYDFGTMSPYTMFDNAVVIFTVIFTILAFARSLAVRIMYLVLTTCVKLEIPVTPHYLFFAVLPLGAEFLYAHKFYILYLYMNMSVTALSNIAVLTLCMARLLQNEFRSVKNIYIVGLLCFLGFSFSIPMTVARTTSSRVKGLIYGLNVSVLYLGGFKVAVVMWVYGVQRFSTDIHFWLGFKPTKFWTMCWRLIPIVILVFVVEKIYTLTQMIDYTQSITAVIWIVFSLIIVSVFQVKTIAEYILSNNLATVFKSSVKYGPPDPDDRKRRRNYTETDRLRQCTHSCIVIDDRVDCNHLPLMFRSKSKMSELSDTSLTHIYQAGPSRRSRTSINIESSSHQ